MMKVVRVPRPVGQRCRVWWMTHGYMTMYRPGDREGLPTISCQRWQESLSCRNEKCLVDAVAEITETYHFTKEEGNLEPCT